MNPAFMVNLTDEPDSLNYEFNLILIEARIGTEDCRTVLSVAAH